MAGSTGPKKMLHENTGPSHGPKYWEGGLLIKVKIIGVARSVGVAAILKSRNIGVAAATPATPVPTALGFTCRII